MSTYKMTFFFASTKYAVGWTESWWTTATSASAAINLTNQYCLARADLLSDAASITAVRACNVDPPRDSLYLTTVVPMKGTIAEATSPIAGVWDCLLCRRDVSTNNFMGHMFLHFVPAAIFTGRDYTPPATPPGWITAMQTFTQLVTTGTWMLNKGPGPNDTYVNCTVFNPLRRSERRLGRPFDALRGKRLVA